MRTDGISVARVMKYIALAAVIAFVVLLMLYASGSNRPFEEVSEAVAESLDTEDLTEQNSSGFKRNFGLNPADYAGVMYYSSESNILAHEVLLIRVRGEGQIRQVTEAIERRVESRKNDFEGFVPEEVQLLEEAVLSVRGSYIFLAVSPEADRYLGAFRDSL